MNNTLEGTKSRITEAEEQISDLKTEWWKSLPLNRLFKKRMKKEKNEDSLGDLWDNIKHTNICIIGAPEGEQREKGPKKTFEEITAENFPNTGKEKVTEVQEAQTVPGRINPRRNTLGHIVIKLTKIKEEDNMLKAMR